jgi:hypothetical protein
MLGEENNVRWMLRSSSEGVTGKAAYESYSHRTLFAEDNHLTHIPPEECAKADGVIDVLEVWDAVPPGARVRTTADDVSSVVLLSVHRLNRSQAGG